MAVYLLSCLNIPFSCCSGRLRCLAVTNSPGEQGVAQKRLSWRCGAAACFQVSLLHPLFDLLSLLCSHPPQIHPVLGWWHLAPVPATTGQIWLLPPHRGNLRHLGSLQGGDTCATTTTPCRLTSITSLPKQPQLAKTRGPAGLQDQARPRLPHGARGARSRGGSGGHRALLPALQQPRR